MARSVIIIDMQKIDKNEILISTAKSAFSLIPFAGPALTELVFDYNGRIKQNRLNRFIELLSDYFKDNSTDTNIENINTEDFNDLFESIIKKVFTTKSEEKVKRFRDILIKELNNPSEETQLTALYLDLIDTLSEEEIIILEGYSNFNMAYYTRLDGQSKLESELSELLEDFKTKEFLKSDENLQFAIKTLQDNIDDFSCLKESLSKFTEARYYNLTESKFKFYKQRLFSKGLLTDEGIDRIGIKGFEMMMITDFGEEFINFVKNK